jgi:hypothetical protein
MKISHASVFCSVSLLLPSVFSAEATATLELEKRLDSSRVEAFLNQVTDRPALDEIAARLALTTAWKLDADKTAAKLAGVLEVSLNGNDGKITATDPSPVMAATLANTAASVLRDRKGEVQGKAREKFDETVEQQRTAVDDKRKLLSKIIREQGIIYQAGDKEGGEPELTAQEKIKQGLAQQAFVDAKNDFETARQLLTELEGKRGTWEADGGIGIHHILWAKAPKE